MTSPLPVSTRQLPETVVSIEDVFGPAYWELNDILTEVTGSNRLSWRTTSVHVIGKIIVHVDREKLFVDEYTEDADGRTIHLDQAAPGGVLVSAAYMKPGTLEHAGWIVNEVPKSNEQPNGTRQDFNASKPISSIDMLAFSYEGLGLDTIETVTLPDGPGTTRIHLSFAPPNGAKMDWTYTTTV